METNTIEFQIGATGLGRINLFTGAFELLESDAKVEVVTTQHSGRVVSVALKQKVNTDVPLRLILAITYNGDSRVVTEAETGTITKYVLNKEGEIITTRVESNGHVGIAINNHTNLVDMDTNFDKTLTVVKTTPTVVTQTVFNKVNGKPVKVKEAEIKITQESDARGNIVKEIIESGEEKPQTIRYQYDHQNRIAKTIIDDELVTRVSYKNTGKVNSLTLHNSKDPMTIFGYENNSQGSGIAKDISYVEEDGFLKELKSNSAKIGYEYDDWGNLVAISYNGKPYVKFETSASVESNIVKAAYANGASMRTTSTKSGEILSVEKRSTPTGQWELLAPEQLQEQSHNNVEVKKELDGMGRIKKLRTPFSNETFCYMSNPRGMATAVMNQHNVSFQYGLGLTTMQNSHQHDRCGNIVRAKEHGSVFQNYEYDELNRLVNDNGTRMTYDVSGNILQRGQNKYEYIGDQMISFNGQKCKYDEIGNPTTYRDVLVRWSLRDMTRFGDVDFRYNGSGLLVEKTHGSNKTKIKWSNGFITDEEREINGDTITIQYLYGDDELLGFKLKRKDESERTFWYIKNIQNDIVAILEQTQKGLTKVAQYNYDAYGNCEVNNLTSENIGELNSFRYRGYFYDATIGKYYLRTRWYDPETGRFMNMDDISILEQTVAFPNGLNLYIYAGNNPVMNVDENGMIFRRVLRGIGNVAQTIVNGMTSVIRTGANLILNPTSVTNTLTGGASNPAPVKVGPPSNKLKPIDGLDHFPQIYGGFPGVSPERYRGPTVAESISNAFRNVNNALPLPFMPRVFLPRQQQRQGMWRSTSGWRII
ncbi:MAG: RHS repeat-associated core domain-containing protein [Firmicutes bacterium]|nr:RHS repeat-associated core domain-containing protein [Bacillota bacterium]